MAKLQSPGVDVTVINESFYTPSVPGTVPLLFVATAENKANGSATGTAQGTLKTNAGKVFIATSQRELADYFGVPIFKVDTNNTPIHGSELNEYGLLSAYSYLGANNRAYIVRADIDLNQLLPSSTVPTNAPANGTYWLNTNDTKYGIFEWNSDPIILGGQTFTNKEPIVITDAADVEDEVDYKPLASIGQVGDYAIVAVSSLITLWQKLEAKGLDGGISWQIVGSNTDNGWKDRVPAAIGTVNELTPSTDDTVTITYFTTEEHSVTTEKLVGTKEDLVAKINAKVNAVGIRAAYINSKIYMFSTEYKFKLSSSNANMYNIMGLQFSTWYKPPVLQMSPHYDIPEYKRTDDTTSVNNAPTGSVWVKTTTPNLGANWSLRKYNESTSSWVSITCPLYATNTEANIAFDSVSHGLNIVAGTIYAKYNVEEVTPQIANFKFYVRTAQGKTIVQTDILGEHAFTTGTNAFTITDKTLDETINISFTAAHTADDINTLLAALVNALDGTNLTVVKSTSTNSLIFKHETGGDIGFADGTNTPLATMFAPDPIENLEKLGGGIYVASLWAHTINGLAIVDMQPTTPTTTPEDNTIWYSSLLEEVDIMINTGSKWVGYQDAESPYYAADPYKTDPAGPIIQASMPSYQSDGTALVNGDLWIDTSDLENYPKIYRYNKYTYNNVTYTDWILIDNTDQTTENGIVFADARWATSGAASNDEYNPSTIVELLVSNYLDPDAPLANVYPKGTLLWNTRRSGFNVKQFKKNYINLQATNYNTDPTESMSGYYPHRWVTVSPNNQFNAGTFGRKAQRAVVVKQLQAAIGSNEDVRDSETRIFNLLACPGYPEVIKELVDLNIDRKLSSFVIGDSPARLKSDSQSLYNWGHNVNESLEDNDDGLVTYDEQLGIYYPWGYTSDTNGNNVVVPPSHMILKTIGLSDSISYPWFSFAGSRRGKIINASAVGYIDSTTGEFVSVTLNESIRDLMAEIKVNPITFIENFGLINYGNLTRAATASAMDRVNISRLVIYLRRLFKLMAIPFIHEQNDRITRDELKGKADSALLELVSQRAIYDFIVCCDKSNNTPERIDRYELYLDVAIEPAKGIEFIYIPIRLKRTGSIKELNSL